MTEYDNNSRTERGYLLGLRGFLVIQSFLWVFLQTFVPVVIKDSANTTGASYEKILRQSLSVLFWNDSLIYSSFIFLSARTICIPFLQNPGKTAISGALFRRGLRLWFPTAVSLAIVKILSSTIGTFHIHHYKQTTANLTISIPYELPNTLAFFNSLFNLFWTPRNFFSQAANTAFPSQTLWTLTVIYTQSYTVYLTMVITPYTRDAWRVKAYLSFIITAWWVQSWAWYSITGLLLTDAVINMHYAEKSKHGIKIWPLPTRCPIWLTSIILMAGGLGMQFLWTDWRPQYSNKELLAHAGRYSSSGLITYIDPKEPQARDDDYLLILGFHLLLESSNLVQRIFRNPLFTYLGRRSLSYFLLQSTIIYTAGINLHLHLSLQKNLSTSATRSICLLACTTATVVGAEIFYRLVEHPSKLLAGWLFDWIRT